MIYEYVIKLKSGQHLVIIADKAEHDDSYLKLYKEKILVGIIDLQCVAFCVYGRYC